jgi:nucleoside-diphosphate-sugar epimerase
MAGVKRGVLLNSYFSYFDRTRPEMHLADNHPYIRSRREQAKESLAASLPDLELMVLELPWVFEATPGRPPSWKFFVKYAQSPWPLFFTEGGTNMIAVPHVAQAIVNAIEHGKGGETYLVGDENVTWREFLTRLSKLAGKPKNVITIPTPLARLLIGGFQMFRTLQGKSGGLVPGKFVGFQTSNTFFDPAPSRQALGYGQGGLDQAFQDTIRAASNP